MEGISLLRKNVKNMKESAGERLKILFITRKFPPALGGMERVAYELYVHLSQITHVELIKWGGSNKWLPLVLPYFLLKSCWILFKNKANVVYLQDGLLSPLGLILKRTFGKPTLITIHGLDITYKNRFYQFFVPTCVSRLDKIICISNATKEQCINRFIPKEKIVFIPNGVSGKFYTSENKIMLRKKLSKKLNLNLRNKRILLSVGRLVERKGFHWFIVNVMPRLLEKRNDVIYLISGNGPLREKLKNLIEINNMKNYIRLIGKIDDETLIILYNSSDVFIMPNIHVEGDMEGFGIVVIEASSCGLPVVASRLEGIKDAIKDGKNGFLVEEKNESHFSEKIITLLNDEKLRKELGKKGKKFVKEQFNWEKIAERYLKEFGKLKA